MNTEKILGKLAIVFNNLEHKEDDENADLVKEIINEIKALHIADVSNLLCGVFEPDNITSSATKCKNCGREKWEHPKAT